MSSSGCDSIYYNRIILAPMVRICSLGFRLLCEKYGADVLFSEEVVAAKLCHSHREVRAYPGLGDDIVEYVVYEPFKKNFKRSVVFSTLLSTQETPKPGSGCQIRAPVILQLGVSDAALAAKAVALCQKDIDGVDINMGCPKKFSVSNGFGAVLMEKTDVAGGILREIYAVVHSKNTQTTLYQMRGRSQFPISFKIRLKSVEPFATVVMLKEILMASGHTAKNAIVHAITIHARLREQRSEDPPLYDLASQVVWQCHCDPYFAGICFVLNGSIQSRADGIAKILRYGFDAAMIARAALLDARCFSPSYVSRVDLYRIDQTDQFVESYYIQIMKEMLLFAICYHTLFYHFKYHLTRIFPEIYVLKTKMPIVQEKLRSYNDCCDFFGLNSEELKLVKIWQSESDFARDTFAAHPRLLPSLNKNYQIDPEFSSKEVDREKRPAQVRRLCCKETEKLDT